MSRPGDAFEKLGLFYLGRRYDLRAGKRTADLVLYDSKDLVTHAVCIGMTGSGKTGLCLALIEEAALDGVPALVIDPKGDLGNLLLTFPDLRPADFLPWINADDARRAGVTETAYAEQQAELWKSGLADWGQGGERIRRLRAAADFAIYTPGSRAGLPVALLKSFAAPSSATGDDDEAMRERVSATVGSLLGLLGIEADPLRSREHILLSTLVSTAWRRGGDLDLPGLIQQIQEPPVTRVGVLDMESFYPAKERFELAMALNNLLAAPGFELWLEGEPLDISRMLYTAEGKPRVAIFSIAHLTDAERMAFVSLLLSETVGWMRAQSGTTSLRAIVYMDEIFGYFPPVANPPSKTPLLTLLKQARAFGVGVVLATQNPVDLDYKGLANAGTWFIGRLQTERDRERVLAGLQGAAITSGRAFDATAMTEVIGALRQRLFLMHNVHETEPVVFESRWAMSYLRGPLTRDQIRKAMEFRAPDPAPTAGSPRASGRRTVRVEAPANDLPRAKTTAAGMSAHRPVVSPAISQVFLPLRDAAGAAETIAYAPMVLGAASIRFADAKLGVDTSEDVIVLTPITDAAVPVDWQRSTEAEVDVSELEQAPREPATYDELPAAAAKPKSYEAWRREFVSWLHASHTLELLHSRDQKLTSRPGESDRDFRARLQQGTREQRDDATERLRRKYAPRITALQERLRRAQQAVARESEQSTQSQVQAAISIGATLIGAVMGRKTVSAGTVGRATTAARGVGRAMKERQDIGRARETVEALQAQLAELEAAFDTEADAATASLEATTSQLDRILVKPKKTNISVRLVTLAWVPRVAGSSPG